MSESVSASTSSASTSAAPAASSAPASSSTPSTNQASAAPSAATAPPSATPASQTTQAPNTAAAVDDGFEVVRIGAHETRVDKATAKIIKELEQGFRTKAQEAAAQNKLLKLARENAKEFFKQEGKDPYEFAEQVLAEKYEYLQMSPEQRELQALKAQVAEREQMERSSKEQIVKELYPLIKDLYPNATEEQLYQFDKEQLMNELESVHQKQNQVNQSLEAEILEAWKDQGLPKSKYFGAQMAFKMMNHAKATNSPLQAKEAAAKVKQEFFSHVQEIVSSMSGKQIEDLLGPNAVKTLRQFGVEQATGQNPALQTQTSPAPQAASGSEKKYVNQAEYRRLMGIN